MSVDYEKSLSEYIIFNCIFILTIIAAFMILFISLFSNYTIRTSINSKLPRSGKYYAKNIRLINNEFINLKALESEDMEGIEHIILNQDNQIIFGSYPLEDMKKIPFSSNKVQKIPCGNYIYYVHDYFLTIRDSVLPYHYKTIVVRSFINDAEMRGIYYGVRRTGYVSIALVLIACVIIIIVMIRRIEKPMHDLRFMAEKIGESQDLSERIEIEDENAFSEIKLLVKANNTMLERAETLLSVQRQFSSDVAHEIKTPISVIIAQCQYCSKYLTKDQEILEAFQLIEDQAKKTSDIVTKLFELTRLEHNQIKLQMEIIEFSEIIQSVCDSEPLFEEKDITLHKEIQKCFISVDINLMLIAIRNIINNALKYSYNCSEIWIKTKIQNGYFIFQCKDQGCGMDEEELSNIFHRFYRSDISRHSDGFGLGLSITKNIVELHQGRITVKSKKNEGTVFVVELPLTKTNIIKE